MNRSILYLAVVLSGTLSEHGAVAMQATDYPIAATGQTYCYDAFNTLRCPSEGQLFYGQDAQFSGKRPRYTLTKNGLSIQDIITGLIWQRSPDTNGDGELTREDKLTWSQAQRRPEQLNALRYGGFNDWRLPTIKELYSLIDFNGKDPGGGENATGISPFIDTEYFAFAYGRADRGERLIDSQYASSTLFINRSWQGVEKLFGVNFADGRIKGYDLTMPGGKEKTFYVLCVRGNPTYGKNQFVSHGNGTISDKATGLMWSQTDSGKGMTWAEALAWAQTANRQKYLGYGDWRLPNAKELHSIVDYSRSPDATGSAAINPVFETTTITNEAGQRDYPAYWSSTTHASPRGGMTGIYFAFGRAMGYMRGNWQDVHGAGSQRSDPKDGNPAQYPYGRGPQGDAIRIYNFVRLVR